MYTLQDFYEIVGGTILSFELFGSDPIKAKELKDSYSLLKQTIRVEHADLIGQGNKIPPETTILGEKSQEAFINFLRLSS